MAFPAINFLAVVIAALANIGLGFIWYSPFLLGKQWAAASGKNLQEMSAPGPAMALTMIGALISAFALAIFIGFAKGESAADGAVAGLTAGIGFVATAFAAEYLFAGRSFKLYVINVAYQVLGLVVMGAILGSWR